MHRLLTLFLSLILGFVLGQISQAKDNTSTILHHDISATVEPILHSISCQDRITARLSDRQSEIGFLLNASLQNVQVINSPGFRLERRPIAEYSHRYRAKLDRDEISRYQYVLVHVDQPDSMVHFTLAYEGIIYDTLKTLSQEYARGFASTTGIIDTQGVYLAEASGWIPTQRDNSFTFKLKTQLPIGWHCVSQGEETLRQSDRTHQITEWTCNEPMKEIYLIAGKYIITEEDHHGIDIMTYTYQDDPALAQKYRDATKRYIDMYSKQIGPYPYRKFALVENFWQTGYGMPSFTLLGSQVIRLPFIIGTSYGHEILHNWWGNGVFVEYEKGNWCEGLTNYMADHYYKKMAGEDAAYRRTMLQSYLDYVQDGRDFPLRQFSERHDPATQAIGYNKSGMIFHMLEKMGREEKFLSALQSFYRNNRFKSASWKTIENEFGIAYSKNLNWFFDQWINRAGAPVLKIEKMQLDSAGNKWKASITLKQDDKFYHLNIPIRFTGNSDTTVIVTMKKTKETFAILLSEKPKQVWVDPDFDIFRKLDRAEIPPALSQTFGAKQSIIIVPGSAEKAVTDAYQKMAEQWKTSDGILIKSDRNIKSADLQGKAVWILGAMNKFLPPFIASLSDKIEMNDMSWRINGQEFPAAGHTFIFTARNPDDPQFSWTFIHANAIDNLPVIGRKLPHYGKYGYLVFKGADNVLKGEWGVSNSPMCWIVK